MFHLGEAAWSIAARTAIIYVVLLVGFRLTGKRQIGQMTPFDLVVILLIANAVQNSMVGHDVSVTGGLIAAAVLLVGNYGLARLSSRVGWLERVVEGEPTLLVRNGKFIEKNLEREDVDKEEILMAMREHGLDDIKDVELAVLETDGSISIVQAESGQGKRATKPRRIVRFIRH
jgi:uncharacterized membrane protein YcaP (DUF421 family)